MDPINLPLSNRRSPRSSNRGVALVIVLGCLVFVTILVLAFFTAVRTESVASKSSLDNNSSRILSETAVNIVQAQIREATVSANTAWASQPGMVRTFDTNGSLVKAYKLYSSATMVTNAINAATELAAISSWSTTPAMFTDLNEPGKNASGSNIYPIVAALTNTMDGFSVSNAPVATNLNQTNPIPMPATWLYVLRDGSVVAPTAGSNSNLVVVTGATSTNPVVGRVAFWADDETSKVNINTAGGDGVVSGTDYSDIADKTFWDVPRFTAGTETNLAARQPANSEFQRYPGHPGTVALRNVLQGLGVASSLTTNFYSLTPRYGYGGSKGATISVVSNPAPAGVPIRGDRLYASVPELLFNMSRGTNGSIDPNVVSQAGFFLTAQSRAPELNLYGLPRVSIWPITDFRGFTQSGTSVNTNTAQLTGTGLGGLTNFTSPVPTDTDDVNRDHISPTDQLLAFSATLPGSNSVALPYYFIRQSAAKTDFDINSLVRNRTLLTYLDVLTASGIPGLGGSLRTKYTQNGVRQILTEMFDYVRCTNTQDGSLEGNAPAVQRVPRNPNWFAHDYTGFEGQGQISPSKHSTWGTQGLGSFPRLSEATVHFVGMGENPASNSGNVPANTIPVPNVMVNMDFHSSMPGAGMTTTAVPISGAYPSSPGQRAVMGFFYLSFINPAQAWGSDVNQMILVVIKGLDNFALNGTNMGFKSTGAAGTPGTTDMNNIMMIGRPTAGDPLGQGNNIGTTPMLNMLTASSIWSYLKQKWAIRGNFPYFSLLTPVAYDAGAGTTKMDFSGGTVTIEVYDLADSERLNPSYTGGGVSGAGWPNQYYGLHWPEWPYYEDPAWLTTRNKLIQTYTITFPAQRIPVPGLTKYPVIGTNGNGNDTDDVADTTVNGVTRECSYFADRWKLWNGNDSPPDKQYGRFIIDARGVTGAGGDVARSMVATTDVRTMAVNDVSSACFSPITGYTDENRFLAHNMWYWATTPMPGGSSGTEVGKLVANAAYPTSANDGFSAFNAPYDGRPAISPGVNGVTTTTGAPGDWDNGIGNYPDGPWINKADEGNLPPFGYSVSAGTYIPYYTQGASTETSGDAFFSPNRQVPSPVMFGSLPSGINPTNPAASKGWQTLLFRPGSSTSGLSAHPGEKNQPSAGDPADYAFLDLFWMPVAEPYAISEPFSTAGKINMNYQIMPYSYINRSTAVRAALASEKFAINLPGAAGGTYKWKESNPSAGLTTYAQNTRTAINMNATLGQFETRFSSNDIFHSATELCSMYLVPSTQGTLAGFASSWYDSAGSYALVGDNVRERPYANLYAKLTTKSNTYRVHYRVQALQKRTNSTQDAWEEGRDIIAGEKRGSTIIERYLDSTAVLEDFATTIGNGTTTTAAASMEPKYKFRVIQSTAFTP